MDGHAPFLRIDTRAQHLGGTEQHADAPLVHRLNHRLALLLGLRFLNEAYLVFGDAVVFDQLALDFTVRVPLVGLVSAQVAEHELCPLVFGIAVVILRNHVGAMGCLVVAVVVIFQRVDEPHVERHLAGIVGGDEHLGFFLLFRQRRTAQYGGVAGLGELHELGDKLLLVGRGRDVVQYLVLLRAVDADVLRRAEVGDFGIERGEFGHLDEIAEAFLLHNLVGHGKLIVDGLAREHRRPCVEGADALPFQFVGAQVFEQEVEFGQRVADGRTRQEGGSQVLAGALLDGADGEEHVERALAALRVAQPRHTVVARGEHEVLEAVRFIDKDMVDAHALEVRHIVLAVLYLMRQFLELDFEVHLAFLRALELGIGHLAAQLVQHLQVFLHAVQLLLQDVALDFGRLRYHAELLVREDDGIPVVVLHLVEDFHAAVGREVLLARIEYLGVGIGGAEGLCNLVDVRLQAGNERLVRQSEPLHLVGGDAHYQRLAATHLVVGDAVHLQHPDTVFLRGIQILDAQSFQIKVRKGLVAAVELGAHEAVELAVVHVLQFLLELRRLFHEPVGEASPYLVNLRGFGVAHLDVLAVLVRDGLGDVGRGVVDGVAHEGDPVEQARFGTDCVLVIDTRAEFGGADAVLVRTGVVADRHVGVE